jgi:hypothetical protein
MCPLGKVEQGHAQASHLKHHITNLTSHDLEMKIVQNSFIRNSYILQINIVH